MRSPVCGAVTWNDPPEPVKVAGVFVYGPVTSPALCRMNALVVSNVFVVLNDSVTIPPDTTAFVNPGGGTITVSAAVVLRTPPPMFVTPAV